MAIAYGDGVSTSGGGKKKKKKPSSGIAAGAVAGYSGGSTYKPPPRSYSQPSYYGNVSSGASAGAISGSTYRPPAPKPAPKPKPPTFAEIVKSMGLGPDSFNIGTKPASTSSLLGTLAGSLDSTSKIIRQERREDRSIMDLFTRPLEGEDPGRDDLMGGSDYKANKDGSFTEVLKQIKLHQQGPSQRPVGTEIDLPKRFTTRKDGSPRPHYDQEYIDSVLANSDEFTGELFMSRMIDRQFKDKEKFAFERTSRRTDKIKNVLGEAQDALMQDGDFDYLENYMEKRPNFSLNPLKYRNDYGITADYLRKEMQEKLKNATSREEREQITQHYEGWPGKVGTYEKIQDSYAFHKDAVTRAVEKYEKIYEDSVEDQDLDYNPGPAIPKPTIEGTGRTRKQQQFIDDSADDTLSLFYLGKKGRAKQRQQERENIKVNLGVNELPSVKDMLTYQAQEGIVNPKNDKQMRAAIERLKNPAHPDTRGLYAAFAMLENPRLDEKDLVGFINEHYNSYVETFERVTKEGMENRAKDSRIAEVQDAEDVSGPLDFWTDTWDFWTKSNDLVPYFDGKRSVDLPDNFDSFSKTEKREWFKTWENENQYSDYVNKEGKPNKVGFGIAWTFDKLLRANYSVAAMMDETLKINQDRDKNTWSAGDVFNKAIALHTLPIRAMTGGENPLNSIDEIIKDPSKLGDIADAGYQQLFRGSGFDGIKDDVTPITFSQVIAGSAKRDPDENIYDSTTYQNLMGLVSDVALDPTTYVGVGLISGAGKLALRKAPSLAPGLSISATAAERISKMTFGNLSADAVRGKLARTSVKKANWVSRLTKPGISSAEADRAFKVRKLAAGHARELDELGDDVPYEIFADGDPLIKDLNKSIDDLNAQMAGYRTDVTTGAMRDAVREAGQELNDAVPMRTQMDLRTERIMSKASEKNVNLHGFIREVGDLAKESGSKKTVFAKGEAGARARKASSDLDNMLLANRQRGIDNSMAADEISSLQSVIDRGTLQSDVADFEDFLAKGGEFPETSVAKVHDVYARALNVDPADLNPQEIAESLVLGRRVLERSDNEFYRRTRDLQAIVRNNSKRMADLRAKGLTHTDKFKRDELALQNAVRQLNTDTVGASIHYLESLDAYSQLVRREDGGLARVRRDGGAAYRDPAVAARTQSLLDEAILLGKSRSGDTSGISAKTSSDLTDRDLELTGVAAADDIDFSDISSITDIPDWDSNLEYITDQLKRSLDRQRLDKSGRLTAVPPLKASTLKANVPDSFKGPDGTLNVPKLKGRISFRRNHESGVWEIKYNAKGLGPDEVVFLRDFTKTVEGLHDELYLKTNLHKKSDITGIGVKTKAKNVFLGGLSSGPERHVIAVGTKEFRDPRSIREIREQAGDKIKSYEDDFKREDWSNLNSSQLNNQRIHEAIKKSDEDGIPPVVYLFRRGAWDAAENRYLKRTFDYAQSRGVTVVDISRRPGGRPSFKTYRGDKVSDKPAPVKKDRITLQGTKFENSAWGQNFPEGFESPQQLMETALQNQDVDDFFDVFFSAGSPLNLMNRPFTQTDAVIQGSELVGDTGVTFKATAATKDASKGLKRYEFNGVTLGNTPKKMRSEIVDYVTSHLDEFPIVKAAAEKSGKSSSTKMTSLEAARYHASHEVADPFLRNVAEDYLNYVKGLQPQAQFKLFNDIYSAAKKSQDSAATKAIAPKKSKEDPAYVSDSVLARTDLTAIQKETFDEAFDTAVKAVNEGGVLPGTTAGKRGTMTRPVEGPQAETLLKDTPFAYRERRNVNETAADMRKEVNDDYRVKSSDAKARLAHETDPELQAKIKAELRGLEAAKAQLLKQIEQTRVRGHDYYKLLRREDAADAIIQTTFYHGDNLSEAQARQLVASKKADLESPGNIYRAPEIAAEATIHQWYKNVSDIVSRNFVRPSRQFKSYEMRDILALVTGVAPLLTKSHFKRISDRMGGMKKDNRQLAFEAMRNRVPYQGPQIQYVDGIRDEMNEIADIIHGDHPFYQMQLEMRPNDVSFVTNNDLLRFLPEQWAFDVKALNKLRATRTDGKATIGDIWNSIPKNNRPQGVYDPAVFAHVYRIAANQALQNRIAKDAINRTFGVPRSVVFSDKTDRMGLKNEITGVRGGIRSANVEGLNKLGWRTIDRLGNTHYFHPSVVDEVNNLTRLLDDVDARTEFGKLMDSALSGWKGLHTTYSIPYYTRNLVGETLMSWMSGVKDPTVFSRSLRTLRYRHGEGLDLAQLVAELPMLQGKVATNVVKGTGHAFTIKKGGYKGTHEELLALYSQYGLTSTFVNTEVRTHGSRSVVSGLFSDRALMRKAKAGFNKIHEGGEYFEDFSRLATFIYHLEHAPTGNLASAASYAAEKVRRFHFDYTDVSKFEKLAVARAYPFFKWTRFAAPVMVAHLFLSPGKMAVPAKGMSALAGTLSGSDVFEDENGHLPDYTGMAPAWVRDLFAYQVTGMQGAEDGYATYIRMATPQTDALTALFQIGEGSLNSEAAKYGQFTDTQLGLLNPFIKSAIELSRNQGLDTDFGEYPIRGGNFNDSYNVNDVESTLLYLARQAGPFAKSAADIYRNEAFVNDDGESYGDYREEQGYKPWKQMVSNLSGMSVYQAKPDEAPVIPEPVISPPVGQRGLREISGERGRKPAQGDLAKLEQLNLDSNSEGGGQWIDYPEGRGWVDFGNSGWVDFGNSGWTNYGSGGYGGYGGGGYSGGSSSSAGGSSITSELFALIQALKNQIDQGDVI